MGRQEKPADQYHYLTGAKTFSFDVGSSEEQQGRNQPRKVLSDFRGGEVKVLVDGKPARSSST